MAVDTRDRRMSMVTLASPVPMVLPDPDGAFGVADRAMLLWLYHGITLSEVVVAVVVAVITPAGRVFEVKVQDRTFEVSAHDRVYEVKAHDSVYEVQ